MILKRYRPRLFMSRQTSTRNALNVGVCTIVSTDDIPACSLCFFSKCIMMCWYSKVRRRPCWRKDPIDVNVFDIFVISKLSIWGLSQVPARRELYLLYSKDAGKRWANCGCASIWEGRALREAVGRLQDCLGKWVVR